jgi:hypothetical protein
VQRFIKVEFLLKAYQVFGSEFRVEGIYLAWLSRSKINNEKGNDRNKEQRYEFLKKTSQGKRKHSYITKLS